jgi:glycosyltransferase involved in cell wall biosynthesis
MQSKNMNNVCHNQVLVISRDFVPYFPSLGGVVRVLKMSEFLDQNGFIPVILSSKGYEINYFGYEEEIKKLRITYIEDFIQKRNNLASLNKAVPKKKNVVLSRIKRFVNQFIIPDTGVFVLFRYISYSNHLISKYNIANVIITSPPFSMQLVGLWIKLKYRGRINLIVDYRDGWNTTKIHRKENRFSSLLSREMERSVLKRANYLTACSKETIEQIDKKIISISSKAHLVMNGFDSSMISKIKYEYKKGEVVRVGYFGAISDKKQSYRNPAQLLSILRVYFNGRIDISFYGDIDLDPSWKIELEDQIGIYPGLSHLEALNEMTKFDILLVLHTEKDGASEVLTGKLFDYLLSLRPILVIGPESMAAKELVENKKLGYTCNSEDQDNMIGTLEKIYHDWENDDLPAYTLNDIMEFSRQGQYRELVDLLNRIDFSDNTKKL